MNSNQHFLTEFGFTFAMAILLIAIVGNIIVLIFNNIKEDENIEINKLVELLGGKTQSIKCVSVGLIWIGANLIGRVFQSSIIMKY